MPGVATETHAVRSGFLCRQFYGTGQNSRYFAPQSVTYRGTVTGTSSSRGYDVTDNKTNDQLLPPNASAAVAYQLKPIYTMNDRYHREDERLSTFDNWPIEWLDREQLARTGMFFTGECDKVKCYFCEVEIGRWEREDQPVSEHLRWSPNCPLLRRRTTNNLPICVEALERILPPASYDICGGGGGGANEAMIEVRPHAYAEGTIAAPSRNMIATAVNTNGGATPSCPNYFPEYPEYAIEAARVRSFAEWPRHMKQKPEQLAEAGFFYTGVGDRVKCYSCGGGLKDWDECDEPWEQHALWLSTCRFLKLMRGQQYVDATIAKHKAAGATDDEPQQEEPSQQVKPTAAVAAVAAVAPLSLLNDAASFTSSAAATSNVPSDVAPQAARIYDMAIAACTEVAATFASVNAAAEKKSPHSAMSNIPEEKLCKICYAAEYNTAFLPCGHVVACAKCASSVTKCPLCRKPFTDVMRVYFS